MQDVSPQLEEIVLNGLYPYAPDPSPNSWNVENEKHWDWTDVLEIYAPDYVPDTITGWNPAEAVERFASIQGIYFVPGAHPFRVLNEGDAVPVGALAYRCEVKARGDADTSMGREFNSCSITMSNLSRYVANMIQTYPFNMEGYRAVIRTISQTYQDQGIVIFSGRLDKPGDFDEEQGALTAKEDFGGIETDIPPRIFTVDDPQGRPRTDPLYEGFAFVPVSGTFQYQTTETRRFLFFFKKKKSVTHTEQWSAFSGTPLGDPIPLVGGRAQLAAIPIEYKDGGYFVAVNGAFCEGRIEAIDHLQSRTPGFTAPFSDPARTTIHLGDVGGTGTNATPDQQFPTSIVYSRLAYVGTSFNGSQPDIIDDAPEFTGIVLGSRVPLPDGAGVFNQTGWTDIPPYLARWIISDPRLINYKPEMIDDPECFQTANFCEEVILDDSQADRAFASLDQIPLIGTGLIRLPSTGIINSNYYRYYGMGEGIARPELSLNTVETFDPSDPPDPPPQPTDPAPPAPVPGQPWPPAPYPNPVPGGQPIIYPLRKYRRRFTANFALTSRTKAIDFLYNTLLPSFRGFLAIGANGKLKIKSERAADNCFIRGNQAAGIINVPVDDVERWKANPKGFALIGYGLITSEIRRVPTTSYSVAGNAITLSGAANGTLTLTASGATFAGGTALLPASGHLDVGGVAQVSATIVATIDGNNVAYTLEGGATLESAAAMLATAINADPILKTYVRASWDAGTPQRVSLFSKMGFLNLDAPLLQDHASAEEIIRIQAYFDASSIAPKSFKWPLGSSQTSTNQVSLTYFDASQDFQETTLIVNDYDHQAQVGKTNKIEIDGGCIDNFHQAKRIANAYLAKYRDGNWRATLKTDPRALLLEEGDLIAASDDSGGLINVVLRIESRKIAPDHWITMTSRIYSTAMFQDNPGQHEIPLPSVLKYIAQPPPVASALNLQETGAFSPEGIWIPKILVTFAFGAFIGEQIGRVEYKLSTESEWTEWSRERPRPDNTGRTIISGLSAGIYNVRVRTESAFGQSLTTGHPQASITLTGRTTIPPDVSGLTVEVVGGRLRFTWNGLDRTLYPDFVRFDVFDGSNVKIGESAATYWMENLPPSSGTITRRFKAVLRGERISSGYASSSFTNNAPGLPSGFAGGIVGNSIRWAWNANSDVYRDFAYFQIYTDVGLTSLLPGAERLATTFFVETPGSPGTYTRYLVAVNSQGLKSTPLSGAVTLATMADVAGLTSSDDGRMITFTWTENADPDKRLFGYEIYDNSNNLIGFETKPSFRIIPPGASFTIKVKALDVMGNRSANFASRTHSIPAPNAPTTATPSATWDGKLIHWNWIESTSPFIDSYNVRDTSGNLVFSAVGGGALERPVYGTASYSRRVYAVRNGIESSSFLAISFTIPNPADPTGVVLDYNGEAGTLVTKWNALADLSYDVATANNGTGILNHQSDGQHNETGFSTASRSFTRYVRATNENGLSSNWIAASLTVSAPAAPTLSRTANSSNVDSVVYTITPPGTFRADWVIRTVVEVASDAGFTTIVQTHNLSKVAGSVFIGGDVTKFPTVYVRARYEDAFGAGSNSASASYTFTQFSDGFFDPNSNLVRLDSNRQPLMAGGGIIAFSAGGVLSWSAPFLISPVSVAIQPTGVITIAANNATLTVGQVLVARQTIGSSSAPTLIVANASTYSAPPITGTTFDIPLAHYSSGGLKLYSGHILALGQSIRAGTFIADLSIIDAMIQNATITSAKILSLEAGKIAATTLQAYIIFGDKIGSSNFVAYGDQASQTETVTWAALRNWTLGSDGTLTKNSSANWDAYAESSRMVHHGDCTVSGTLTSSTLLRGFGLTWAGEADPGGSSVYAGIDFWIDITVDGTTGLVPSLRIFINGTENTFNGVNGMPYATGDVVDIKITGTSVAFRKNGTAFLTLTGQTVRPAMKVVATAYDLNSRLEPLTLTGLLVNVPTSKEKVQLTNQLKATLDTSDNLTFQGNGSSWGDSGASSFLAIPANTSGGFEFELPDATGQDIMIGLSTSDPDQNYSTIGWAFYAAADGSIQAYRSGTPEANTGAAFRAATDKYRIAREGTSIIIRKNGAGVWSFSTTTTAALYLDIAAYTSAARIKNLRILSAGAIGQGWQAQPNGIAEYGKGIKIAGILADDLVARGWGSINAFGRYRGNDRWTVTLNRITSARVARWAYEDADSAFVNVALSARIPSLNSETDTYSNTDSVMLCQARVLNEFGEEIAIFDPFPYNGDGICSIGRHSARYAHPEFQAIYALKFMNSFGYSPEIFLQNGTLYYSMPTTARRYDIPSELTANFLMPQSGTNTEPQIVLSIGQQNSSYISADVEIRRRGASAWRSFVGIAGGQTGWSSIAHLGISAEDEYELRARKSGGTYWVNVLPIRAPSMPYWANYWAAGLTAILNTVGSVNLFFNTYFASALTGAKYRIYREEEGQAPTLLNSIAAAVGFTTGILYTDATAARNKRYRYYVVATYDPSGTSYQLASKSILIEIPSSSNPADPTNLRTTDRTTTQLNWAWNLNSAVGAVTFEWKAVGATDNINDSTFWASGVTSVSKSAGSTTHPLAGLTPGQKYAARVKVADAGTIYTNYFADTTLTAISAGYTN